MKVTVPMSTATLPEEFERIFQEHHRLVHRTAYRVTGSFEDAEDVLQSVFLRLLRCESLKGFHENPKAYLYRSAVNLSLDVIRRRGKRAYPSGELRSQSLPEETAIQERLRSAMTQLSPKAAETLILRHVHGYTDREIAHFLGTSRATVAVSLYRARARIRKLMSITGGKP